MTLTEVLVVIIVLAVLVAVLLPAFISNRNEEEGLGLRGHYRRAPCVENLNQIALAFKVWEGDHSDKYPMQLSTANWGSKELALNGDVAGIFRTMSNELSTPKVLVCPEDTGRHYATNFTTDFNNQKISYFVGMDVDNKSPQMIILSGDDNLAVNGVRVRSGILNLSTNASVGWTMERHHGVGNVALADGSVQQINVPHVQQLTVQQLQQAFQQAGLATNRLAIP